MFKIGEQIKYLDEIVTIIGFSKNKKSCVIEGYQKGHSVDNIDYWYDDDGNKIKYYKGTNRYYIDLDDAYKLNIEINYEIY